MGARWALGFAALGLILLVAAALTRDPPLALTFRASDLGPDLDRHFAIAEAAVPNLRPAVAKRIVWGDPATRARTRLAVVYLHGFSASNAEIAPVPEQVAAALEANLFLTRLAGHGRDGAAMAEASVAAWLDDVAEAVEVGRRIGDRVIIIATSTGGALATIAAGADGSDIAGIAFVSPNFGLLGRAAFLLDWPLASWSLRLVLGRERGLAPINDLQATIWTTRYPTVALLPMAEAVRRANRVTFGAISIPALFVYSPTDTFVDPARTEAVAALWGGPTTLHPVALGEGDDPAGHLVAGDAMSPARTAEVTEAILVWARGL